MHMAATDLLYSIFEQHLFNALVEDETTDEFLVRVVSDYLMRLSGTGMIATSHIDSIEVDLREEVLEMLRKKTYGHYNLSSFRKAQSKAPLKMTSKSAKKIRSC